MADAPRPPLAVPSYPRGLPVSDRKDEIKEVIRDHQVVIVAGETGSGKSTQLPKICLELGRGTNGMIGHTQPRRLAARTLAERIAEELGTTVGAAVGYTVRFTDQVSDETYVKLMTDGILLAELQRDRALRRYDTLIVDEAHERSLNIDFILGYLKQLLPRRPDLKVVITSATIDTERFSSHFDDAPIVEVSGRTYPVEVRYRPLVDDEQELDRDQVQAILDAVDELEHVGPGDILVFLSGEREIRDTAEALRGLGKRNVEILPLYARLSAAEQHRVFQPHPGRRVVLATNVAETSLTVPGIRYVVDAGTARVSRYNRRTKVQRLPIEAISQAAANQRSGRCGRVAAGIAIRLYAEADFEARPEYTDPEILRTNLASVILQMASIGLGDVSDFPFVDPPDARNIKDGVALLEEIGALRADDDRDLDRRLTKIGRKIAQLPLDPRLARMVIEADRNGCVREVMAIAAALSIQDPRERPAEKRQAADEYHARFVDKDSDFLTLLHLWDFLHEQQKALSSNQFRKLCRTEYLNYVRVREWQDIYSQLRQVARTLGIQLNTEPARPDSIHLALLAGLLSHVGVKDGERQEYRGAREARFAINPGSVLFKKSPRWVMAAELVETTRLWARVVGRIQPEWIEQVGRHLVKRSYSDPEWDSERGAVMASERVSLYALPVVSARMVNYGGIDPVVSREMFIRHALVEGDWRTPHAFFHENEQLMDAIVALEDRARRRGILVDSDALFDFYDKRVGADVVSARHFDGWWKKVRQHQPDLLSFTSEVLLDPSSGSIDPSAYPETWVQGDLSLRLSYVFDPTDPTDGVTVHVPLTILNRVDDVDFDWHIPGLRHELVTAVVRAMPKHVRRHFVPAPDAASEILDAVRPRDGHLIDVLHHELARRSGEAIPAQAWDLDRLPPYLRVTFRVEDEEGRLIASGKNLSALKLELEHEVRAAIAASASEIEQRGLSEWTFGDIPRVVERTRGGQTVRAFPALVDEGLTVAVRLFETPEAQQLAMWGGTRRLLLLTTTSPSAHIERRLTNAAKLALAHGPYPSVRELIDECAECAVDELVVERGGPVFEREAFATLRATVSTRLPDTAFGVTKLVADVLAEVRSIDIRVASMSSSAARDAVDDIRQQVARFVFAGFVTVMGTARLRDLPRYLEAIDRRLDKLPADAVRDSQRMRTIQRLEHEYQEVLRLLPEQRRYSPAAQEVRWMLEELRISLFAQAIGTAYRVSEERILREIREL